MAESARESRGSETGSGVAPVLTPADIRNAAFGTTRLRTGYDMDEVDAFLDMVEERLAVLLAELQRAQEGEAQYRAQYEQLRARVGSAAPTTIVRSESPQGPQGPQSPESQAQALAQALLIRQALIAQLREHIGQVESQIRSVQASVDSAVGPAVVATVNPGEGTETFGPQESSSDDVQRDEVADRASRSTGPIAAAAAGTTYATRSSAPRAKGPVPADATQEIPAAPRSLGPTSVDPES
ncbi:MAG: DivIVA domain-containing protein [Actinomycetales bacterium]